MANKVIINEINLKPGKIVKDILVKTVKLVLKDKQINNKIVSLSLVDNQFIQNLNYQYRKINKPTDVLSFPQDDAILLGDIFISLPTAFDNAMYYNKGNYLKELYALVIHGILHLLGFDHQTEQDFKLMAKEEKRLKTICKLTLISKINYYNI